MISFEESNLAERYLCLDIALQVNSNSDMLLEYQSVTERMPKLKLLIEHELTAEDVFEFMIKKDNDK